MHQQSTATPASSSVTWDSLEAWVRERIQGFIQDLLEEEVTELLGRRKSERRAAVDPQPGYRNGDGKPRRLTLGCGTITVCRPRVRGLDARFQSRVLPLFARRTREVSALLPELYLHGLAAGDFDLALRGLVGQDAPLSASTVARLKARWQLEWETWSARRLDDLEVVYLWVDGVDVKAGLEKEKAALLVAIAGLSDGRKVVVAVAPGHRESAESWGALLRDLRDRGMPCPRLVIGDGHLGRAPGGVPGGRGATVLESPDPEHSGHTAPRPARGGEAAAHGDCVRADPGGGGGAAGDVRGVVPPARLRPGGGRRGAGLGPVHDLLPVPPEHWVHLRTTNIVESPLAALRLRTDAAKRFKRVANATA